MKKNTFEPTEAQIQKSLLQFLETRQGKFWRQNTGAVVSEYKGKKRFFKFGAKGAGDITGLKDGIRWEIEVKRPKGKQSPSQKEFQKMIEDNGGRYCLAYDIKDLIDMGL